MVSLSERVINGDHFNILAIHFLQHKNDVSLGTYTTRLDVLGVFLGVPT